MAYPPAPPLLLTRRLSSFLHSSLASLQEHKDQQPASAILQTALLVTPSGKLLAYDSPLPVRTLRTHCSVAASLWTIHASSSPSVAVALNQTAPVNAAPAASQTSPSFAPSPAGGSGFASPDEEPYHDGSTPHCLSARDSNRTLGLDSTLPILPPPPPNAAASSASSASPTPITVPLKPALEVAGSSVPGASVRTTTTADTFETAPSGSSQGVDGETTALEASGDAAAVATGSHGKLGVYADRDANADAASTTTTGTTTTVGAGSKMGSVATTMAIARRQVDEVARLLDEKLGALSVPEENIGINGFC
ncbi:MAG: hypothetical protein STHCBS139747_006816 [Sporothrix thermara]